MKVLGVYDGNSRLKCHGKYAFKQTEAFLAKFPKEYSNLYYKNKEDVKILKVDGILGTTTGNYNCDTNVITYQIGDSLGHEIVHMATNDMENKRMAICSRLDIEDGLVEGMTEYMNMQIYELSDPDTYPFEVFCVSMLDNIPDLFKYFFMANGEEFIKIFPDQKSIYSLMWALNIYTSNIDDYFTSFISDDVTPDFAVLKNSIQNVINHLIKIELSFERTPDERKLYAEKYMDLITSGIIYCTLDGVYPGYENYANKVINRKLKRKGL